MRWVGHTGPSSAEGLRINNGQGLSAVSSAGFFEAFRRHLSARPSRVPGGRVAVTGLRAQPTGPGVWAARRWVQARGLGVHRAGISMTPAGWRGRGRVGRGRSGPAVPRPSHAAATGRGAYPGGRRFSHGYRVLAGVRSSADGSDNARAEVLRRQVGPSAGCASLTNRSRPASELLAWRPQTPTIPSHVPRWPFNGAVGEAAAGRAQRPLPSEGAHPGAHHPAAASPRRRAWHGTPGSWPRQEFREDAREGNAQEIPRLHARAEHTHPKSFQSPFSRVCNLERRT